jgi:hypothetical protein
MAPKTRSQCKPDEIVQFTDAYFAAVDVAKDAEFKLDQLIVQAKNSADRSLYRARSLEAAKKVEELRLNRIAFNSGSLSIRPPTDQQVAALQQCSKDLAAVQVKVSQVSTILNLFASGMQQFSAVV